MQNLQDDTFFDLFITTSSANANVNISTKRMPFSGVNRKTAVINGQVEHITLPSSQLFINGSGYGSNAISINADQDISVYGVNRQSASTDGFLAIPVDVLGNEYVVAGYGYYVGPSTEYLNEFLIISVNDNTDVSIHFGINVLLVYESVTYKSNDYLNITLQKFQTFQLQSLHPLTGTYIVSSSPIAVFSGSRCTTVGGGACDHLCSQLYPISKWGKTFVLSPSPDRIINPSDTFVFISSEDNTKITITGQRNGKISKETLSINEKNNIAERSYDAFTYSSVLSDKPVAVYQFINGADDMDATMITIPAIGQYAADYVFTTPQYAGNDATQFTNFFVFVVKNIYKSGLLLDESPFPDSTVYNPVGDTEYVSGFLRISVGTHVIRHKSPIVVFEGILIGTRSYESYGFPAGMRLADINQVHSHHE